MLSLLYGLLSDLVWGVDFCMQPLKAGDKVMCVEPDKGGLQRLVQDGIYIVDTVWADLLTLKEFPTRVLLQNRFKKTKSNENN